MLRLRKTLCTFSRKKVPFYWDERAQRYFEALKKALSSTPVLSPPNYSKDFILYLAASKATIGMVLVLEDDSLPEQAIYYLSISLVKSELSYAHVKKLALATIHTTQRLWHYLSLRKTYVVACLNLIGNSGRPKRRSCLSSPSCCRICLETVRKSLMMNVQQTTIYSSLIHWTCGMELSLSISKPQGFPLMSPSKSEDAFATRPNTTSSSMIHYTGEGQIWSCSGV